MSDSIRRVAKNAAVPMVANLINKVLDFGFAIFMLRTLGPTDLGRYTWAVLVVGYFDILVNFGFGILITRDVARGPEAAGRYLGGAALARVVLWVLSIAAALCVAGPLSGPLGLTPEMGVTLALLTVGIGVSNVFGLASAWFSARELMEYPAAVTVFTTLAKVALGVAALVLGFGIVGLGMVSVAVNILTGAVLSALCLRVLGRPSPTFDLGFSFKLLKTSYPLMISNLLATVFFRVDGLILRALWGDTVLGWYSTAYKFIDGLNAIPSSLTLALFPVLSRLWSAERTSRAPESRPQRSELVRVTELGLKSLLGLALPISVGTTLLAGPLVGLFAGEAFLPHAATALQILIWFLPLSFTNGLLQYVLIAADQQRFITVSFAVAMAFNVAANVVLVPQWSYVGAAGVTILSELMLLALFWPAIRRHAGPVRWLPLAWRPALASIAMAPLVWALQSVSAAVAVAAGAGVYAAVYLALGGVSAEEWATLRRALLPGGWAGPPAGEGRVPTAESPFR